MGESIISNERVAWVSTAQKSSKAEGKEDGADEGRGSQWGKEVKTDSRPTANANKSHPS